MSITEQLVHTTVRIETETADKRKGAGTGYFFKFPVAGLDGATIPVIVTNRHVVKDAVQGSFHLNRNDSDNKPVLGEHFSVALPDFESRWLSHPDDDIDLCVMPTAPILAQAHAMGLAPHLVTLDYSVLPTEDLLDSMSAMEDVVMVGYPTGFWDEKNNRPILRRGVTATHVNLPFCGRPEFVIDMPCFPGSSGSPVYLVNEGAYTTKQGGMVVGNRLAFLGTLWGGPVLTQSGDIKVVTIPTATQKLVATINQHISLGLVIRAECLRAFEPVLAELAKPKP